MGNSLINRVRNALDNGQPEIQSISAIVEMNYGGGTEVCHNPCDTYMNKLDNMKMASGGKLVLDNNVKRKPAVAVSEN